MNYSSLSEPFASESLRLEAVTACVGFDDVLDVALTHRRDVAAAINAASQIHLYGYAATATDPNVDGTRFRTGLTYKVGYGTP
jgi:hypothetical protein